MVSVAKSLDADQLAALAAYYGSLPRPARKAKKQGVIPALVARTDGVAA